MHDVNLCSYVQVVMQALASAGLAPQPCRTPPTQPQIMQLLTPRGGQRARTAAHPPAMAFITPASGRDHRPITSADLSALGFRNLEVGEPIVTGSATQTNIDDGAFFGDPSPNPNPDLSSQRARWRLVVAAGLVVAPFFPAANVLFPVGTFIGERLLYAPSVGFCLLAANTLARAAAPHLPRLLLLWAPADPGAPPIPVSQDTHADCDGEVAYVQDTLIWMAFLWHVQLFLYSRRAHAYGCQSEAQGRHT